MKKIILGICVLATIVSCKKDDDDNNCEKSVAGIAASYKITKVVFAASGIPDQDVTTSATTDCERNGVFELKSDKTVQYTETGSCSGTGSGTWDVVNDNITIDGGGSSHTFTSMHIESWDCNTLTITEDLGGITQKFYLTKQ